MLLLLLLLLSFENSTQIVPFTPTPLLGATGSGKTTQVPQYILDHYKDNRKFCNILVTQPRRIAAISVATRVAKERNWPLKTIVGYQIQLQNEVSEDTRITYLTTGVLLQKMIKNKNLNDYTHIILDEVRNKFHLFCTC